MGNLNVTTTNIGDGLLYDCFIIVRRVYGVARRVRDLISIAPLLEFIV